MTEPARDAADVRFPPPLVFIGFVLLGSLIDRLLDLPPLPTPWWLGLVLIVPGIALVGAAVVPLRASGQDPRPWTPTDTLLVAGPYRWSRNPMYLGMAVAAVGLALALTSMTGAVLPLVAVGVVGGSVIEREEAYLAARLGAIWLTSSGSAAGSEQEFAHGRHRNLPHPRHRHRGPRRRRQVR